MQVAKIRVLVVDDSLLFRKILSEQLSQNSQIEVIGTAMDAEDARKKIPELRPDVVTMDVEMPRLSGIDFLKQLLPEYSVPVVVVSSLNINVFAALSAGAIDFVKKPDMSDSSQKAHFFRDLANKIVIASNARVRRAPATAVKQESIATTRRLVLSPNNKRQIIAIGASTGGTEAILSVVRELPKHTPGIVIVQHMPVGFTKMYAERLNGICQMEVREAADGDRFLPGQILIAPGGLQMELKRSEEGFLVRCQPGEKVSGHAPSVDVLFSSVARIIGSNAIGVILTGMGKDGASGLLAMRKAGAYTIGQDKESSVVYGMPMVAKNIGAVVTESSLSEIPRQLIEKLNSIV